MELMNLICPNSPVWEGYPFSECFNDLVFGFGGNVITIILIAIVGIMWRDGRGRIKMLLPERFVAVALVLEACVSFIHMIFILWEVCNGQKILYNDLMYRCSQMFVWTTILLLSRCGCWYSFCCSSVLCFWWIIKPLLQVPHLQIVLSSSEALWCFEECSVFLLDVAFGISINIIRIRQTSSNRIDDQLEDPLLTHDLEDGHRDSEAAQSFWMHMTFSSIKSIMDKGVTKQLDFGDLLMLPVDMDPSSCYNVVLTNWQAQQIDHRINPSFFRAICMAYGWPYMRLGLLKASSISCNEGMGE